MQNAPALAAAQEHPQNLEMSLREHLLAASGSGSNPSPYPPPPNAGAPGPELPYQPSESASPHDHLDLNVAQQQHQAPYAQMSGDSAGDDGLSPQGGKGKRELSTSKRAAQNRAAQRAFRQRKEGYIKKLEEQVKDFQNMEQNYRALQNENYQLREYILNLQSRLLDSSTDVPPAPSHINLASSSSASMATSSRAPVDTAGDQRYSADSERLGRSEHRQSDQRDPISQLQAAAAQADAATRQQHESPYGLGGGADYANKRVRMEEGGPGGEAKGAL